MHDLKQKILASIDANVPGSIKNDLIQRLCPSIGLKSGISNIQKLSKLGGLPIVDENFEWPFYKDEAMSFICQINLENTKDYDLFPSLKNIGVLYFFMHTSLNMPYPSESERFKVIYLEKPENLAPFLGSIETKVFKESGIEFYPHVTVKRDSDDELDDALESLYSIICSLSGHDMEKNHHIGGYPIHLQERIFHHWLMSDDNVNSDKVNLSQEIINDLEDEFVLLLQLSFADINTNLREYGGDGIAYFGIKKEDLKNKRFDKTYLVCQST